MDELTSPNVQVILTSALAVLPVLALAVLSAALTILLTEPIQRLLAQVLGGIAPRRKRGVRGLWLSEYEFPTGNQVVQCNQMMELRQIGRFVVGKWLAGTPHRHRLSGKVRDQQFLTGFWENVQQGVTYHGAFQLVIHPTGKTMSGLWVGFDSENQIACGNWTWELLTTSLKKAEKFKHLAKWEGQITDAADQALSTS